MISSMSGKNKVGTPVVRPTNVEGAVAFDAPSTTSLFRQKIGASVGLIGEILTNPERFTSGAELLGEGYYAMVYGFDPGPSSPLPPLAIKVGGSSRNAFLLNATLEVGLALPNRANLPFELSSGQLTDFPAYSPAYYGFIDPGGDTSVFPGSTSITVMSREAGVQEQRKGMFAPRNTAILEALNPVLSNDLWCIAPDSRGGNILYDEERERVTVLDLYQ
jgi:hypothetical protein